MAREGVAFQHLPLEIVVPHGSLLRPTLSLYINALSSSFNNPVSDFADVSSLDKTARDTSERQVAATPISADLGGNKLK